MYKPNHFIIEELVDKKTFESNPEWKLWLLFDDRLLKTIDFLREEFGVSITINNWKWKGEAGRQWSGYRPPGSPYYSQFSQHSLGRAVDMLFSGIPAPEVRHRIKKLIKQGKLNRINHSFTFEENMKGVEISWCHLDLRNNKPGYNGFDV
jgi:hypothetical protein